MRALVTGAGGFIGSHLVSRLAEMTDWEVIACARRPTVQLAHHSNLILTDLHDGARLPPADVIFSLAAHVDVPSSIENPSFTVRNNVGIASTLVDYARCWDIPPHIIHVTTAEVFGPGGPHTVEEPARPTNPYAASKAAQDAIFTAVANCYSIPVTIARTANVFGEHQHRSKFVPTVTRNVLAGAPVPLFGDSHRRWVHADDLADALIRLAALPPSTVNLTGAELVSNESIVHRIGHILGRKPNLERTGTQRPGHEDVYDLEPSPIMTDDLHAGLERTVAWWSRAA